MSEWNDGPFSASAKRRSQKKAREQVARVRREDEARARTCQCDVPTPGRVYLGQRLCHVCRRWMP